MKKYLLLVIVFLVAFAASALYFSCRQRSTKTANEQCGPPAYLCATRGTAPHAMEYPFSTETPYNTVAHSALNPNSNAITRLIDQNIVAKSGTNATAFSTGNLSFTGGSADNMCSLTTQYCLFKANGGASHLFHLDTSGEAIRNVTQGGQNPCYKLGGPVGFSRAQENVFYNLKDMHTLTQNTIQNDCQVSVATMWDWSNCPGTVTQGNGKSSSALVIAQHDLEIAQAISWDGGQGTGHMVMVYKPGSGCAALDLSPEGTATTHAKIYTFCQVNCSQMQPSFTTDICFDKDARTGKGIHGINMSGDGLTITISGGAFNLGDGNTCIWAVNTGKVLARAKGTSSWEPDDGQNWSGHNAHGMQNLFMTNNPTPNTRVESPVSECGIGTTTPLYTLPMDATSSDGYHGNWPHPQGDDTGAVILEAANDAHWEHPVVYQNEVFGVFPTPGIPPARFFPTFSSGTSTSFSCGAGIPVVSQDGRFAFWLSDGNLRLGMDETGKPLCSIFGGRLQ